MHLNAPDLMQPVFEFLDGMIRNNGDILFMVFVYAAVPFLVWVLCGGLRRKLLAGKRVMDVPSVTVIYLPPVPPRLPPESLPPLNGQNYEPPWCDHDGDGYRD